MHPRQLVDITVLFTLGVVGSFFFMLLPLLVASLVRDGFMEQPAGLVGSAPLAGMFIGSIVCAATLPRLRWNVVSFLALGTLAGANEASAHTLGSLEALLAVQFIAGFAGVVLMSVTFAYISRHSAPERYFALFIALQMAAGALATVFVERIAAAGGATGIFRFLALCALCAIPLSFLVPRRAPSTGQEVDVPAGAAGLIASIGGLAVLGTQVIFGAGIMVIWSYAARIGESHGISSVSVAQALSFSLLSSIVGALCASAIGRRFRVELSLGAGSMLMVIAAVLATSASSPGTFFLAIALFGFGWNFLPPFQLGIAADLDRSGRLVVLNIALVKLGYALGTASAGVLASIGDGHRLHSLAASMCFVAALLAALVAKSHAHRNVCC
jgi:MFS transporter, DHA1 family, inner membrane transport protein